MKTINFICYDEHTGYGIASLSLMHALLEEEIKIAKTLIKPGKVEQGGQLLLDESTDHVDAVLIHTVPEYYPYWLNKRKKTNPDVPVYGYTAWETDCIPPHWPEILNRMDGIFVPSHWNKEVFLSCGVKVPIHVLPHISEFHGIRPRDPLSPDLSNIFKQIEGDYVFYSIGMWNERKNIPFLLQSFLEEFAATENVTLLLKTDSLDWTTYQKSWKKYFGRPSFQPASTSFQSIVDSYSERAKVIHLTSNLSSNDIAWIHSLGNCFVSFTHGEGWGIGAYEAAWFGNSVAITGYGGQLDFLSSSNAYLAPYSLGPVSTAFGKNSYRKEQKWADVEINEARNILRSIYQNQSKASQKASLLENETRAKFTKEVIANKCIEVLLND